MEINADAVGTILLHAVTAVGIIEWVKRVLPRLGPKFFAWLLPLAALGVAASTLYAPAVIWLRVWAWGQLGYKLLVKLPERLIKGKSDA